MNHRPMNIQHFSIALSRFDSTQLPLNSRQAGTPAFGDAVIRYFAEKYGASGMSVIVEIDDDEIRVIAFPSSFSDPMEVALSLLNQGDLKEALPVLESLARTRRSDQEVLYNLGIAHSELGEFDKAVMRLKQLLETNPTHGNGLVGLGVAYQRLGQSSQAEQYLKQAVKADPSNSYAHRNLGSVLASAGNLSTAASHLRRAHTLAPNDPAATYGLAHCLEMLGNDESLAEADQLFKEVVERFPGTHFDELARTSRTAIAEKSMRSSVGGGLRPDVMMYIAGAMDTFERLGDAKRREIGFEVAILGTKGLDINDPSQKYQLKSMPGEFSGLQLSAIMYTAFHQMDPTLDPGIDFSKEYDAALAFRTGGR